MDALNAIPDAVILIRPDGKIAFFNQQAEKWFGYGRDEVLGQEIELLIPERFRASHQAARARFAASPVRRPMGAGLELFGRRKDGTEFPVDISIGPLTVEGSTFFSAIVRDITERKKLEAERDRAILARDELFAMVTHDLRNPLTAIELGAELLAPRMKGKDRLVAEHILTSTRQMTRLIQEILTASKFDHGTFSVETRPEKASSIVNEVFEIMQPIAARKSIRMRKENLTEELQLPCDRERILQAFTNLVENAIKFSTVDGEIVLRAERKGGSVDFSVTDTGPGIAPEAIPRLFTQYYQAGPARGRGTGLGLWIVKGIVEAHGGKAWVTSTEGKGSSFHFSLPLDPAGGGVERAA